MAADSVVTRFEEYYPVLDFVTRVNAGPLAVCELDEQGVCAPKDSSPRELEDWAPLDEIFQAYVQSYYPNWTGKALSTYQVGVWPVEAECDLGYEVVQKIDLPAAATYLTRGDSLARYWLAMGDKHGFGVRLRMLVTALQAIDTVLDSVQSRAGQVTYPPYFRSIVLRPVFQELRQSGYPDIGPFYLSGSSQSKATLTTEEHRQLVELFKSAHHASYGYR